MNIQELISLLYDTTASEKVKMEASFELLDLGKDAIFELIQKLSADENPRFSEGMMIQRGPMHPAAPRVMAVSVKFHIESLLYAAIYPSADIFMAAEEAEGESAPKISDATLMEMRQPLAFVSDWPHFWADHSAKSLQEIRRWARAEVERKWDAISDEMIPLV
ncbi:hypothetical protein KAI87_08270 [Myxococcota bacterium]|nr:hypothetical protein [Myxococcota bacterium]